MEQKQKTFLSYVHSLIPAENQVLLVGVISLIATTAVISAPFAFY